MSDINLLNSIAAAQDIHLFIDVIASGDEKFLLSIKDSKDETILVLLEQEQFIDEDDGDIRTRETFTSKDNPSTSDTLLSLFTLCKERYHKEQHINYIATKEIDVELEYDNRKIHIKTYKQLHALVWSKNAKERFSEKNHLWIVKSKIDQVFMNTAPINVIEKYLTTYQEKIFIMWFMNNFFLLLPMPDSMIDEVQTQSKKKALVVEYMKNLWLDREMCIDLRDKEKKNRWDKVNYREKINTLALPIYLAMRKDWYTHMQLCYGWEM